MSALPCLPRASFPALPAILCSHPAFRLDSQRLSPDTRLMLGTHPDYTGAGHPSGRAASRRNPSVADGPDVTRPPKSISLSPTWRSTLSGRDLYDEIAKIAYELWEKNGCIHGRDIEHWCEAERIVISRSESVVQKKPERTRAPRKTTATSGTKKTGTTVKARKTAVKARKTTGPARKS